MKGTIVELLRQARETELADLARRDSRAMRHLVGRLYDPDEAIRTRAARALGHGAMEHERLGLELVRRFVWGLNDESATNGVYGIPAIGEIGRRCPEMIAPFVPVLASFLWDDGLRPELMKALARIAPAAPETVGAQLDLVRRHLRESEPAELESG